MSCTLQDRKDNVEIFATDAAYHAEVDSAIFGLIGNVKKGWSGSNKHYHKEINNLLKKFLTDNQLFANVLTTPTDFVSSLREYLFLSYSNNIKLLYSNDLVIEPTSMKAVYTKTKRLMKHMYEAKDKDLNRFATLFRNPEIVAAFYDRTGNMSKYLKSIKSFTDRKEQRFSSQIFKLEDKEDELRYEINSRIYEGLDNDSINDLIGDGLNDFNTNSISENTLKTRRVKIISVSGWENESDIKLKVVFEDDNSVAVLNPTTNPNKKKGVIFNNNVKEELISAIKSKHINELRSEVMNGQIRYIIPSDMPNKSDSAKIKRTLKEESIRYNSDDKSNKSLNSGKLHNIIKDGVKYTYVLVKQPEIIGEGSKKVNGEREVYKA